MTTTENENNNVPTEIVEAPKKKKKKMKLVKKVKKPNTDAVAAPDALTQVDVEPEKKKKKTKKVKKPETQVDIDPVPDNVEVPKPGENTKKVTKKPKTKKAKDQIPEVVDEPIVPTKDVDDQAPVVKAEKKKKKKVVKKTKTETDVPNEVPEAKPTENVPSPDVVDTEGLANVEINVDVKSVVDEKEEVPVITDTVVAPPALRIDVTVIESEYVDIIKNITDMSKALQATMSQLNSLYKKTIDALGQVEQRRPDEVVPPSDLVDMDTQKTLTDEFSTLSGQKTMSKMEAMKFVQDYVVERDLHSDDEKRLVTCDEVLTELFKKESFTYFELSSMVDQHLL